MSPPRKGARWMAIAERTTHENLVAGLVHFGWRRVENVGTRLYDIYEKTAHGEDAEILVPLEPTFRDYRPKLANGFAQLADFECLGAESIGRILGIVSEPKYGVVVEPGHNFGRPSLADSMVPTFALAGCFVGGDSPETIAAAYEIPVGRVLDALRYELRIRGDVDEESG